MTSHPADRDPRDHDPRRRNPRGCDPRGLELEPATVEDVEQLVDLRDDAARWLRDRGIEQWRLGELTAERVGAWVEAGSVHVLREQDRLSACVAVLWSDPDTWGAQDQPAGYLHLLVVDHRRRGRGLGGRVLTWAERHIRRSGRCVARLDAVSNNRALHRWYGQRGYVEVDHRTFPDSHWLPVTLRQKPL